MGANKKSAVDQMRTPHCFASMEVHHVSITRLL